MYCAPKERGDMVSEQVDFATMSDREKYLFDLQGFIVVKGMLSEEEVKALNEALDANENSSEHLVALTKEADTVGERINEVIADALHPAFLHEQSFLCPLCWRERLGVLKRPKAPYMVVHVVE